MYILVRAHIGVVDAMLVRWLALKKANSDCLAIHIERSVFEPMLPKDHLEEFLGALEMVDVVLRQGDIASNRWQAQFSKSSTMISLPEADLLNYSIDLICKRQSVTECESHSKKLTTLDALCERYNSRPLRRETVGIVSGVFDVIHPGHVALIRAAKARVDHLVVLTMSSGAIKQQEKNQLGDRPTYSTCDRVEVLAALRDVDHVVVFDDLNCLGSLKAFCPDYFFKNIRDRARSVVRAEADLVNQLGGQSIYLENCSKNYSSTDIIRYVRQQIGTNAYRFAFSRI